MVVVAEAHNGEYEAGSQAWSMDWTELVLQWDRDKTRRDAVDCRSWIGGWWLVVGKAGTAQSRFSPLARFWPLHLSRSLALWRCLSL